MARPARTRRLLVATLSAAGHGLALLMLVAVQPKATAPPEAPPITVALVAPPRPEPPPVAPEPPAKPQARSPAKAKATIARAGPPRPARPVRAPPAVAPVPAGDGGAAQVAVSATPGVSEAALSGAARAGSGRGGDCDMPARVQAALRRDARVRAAVNGPSRPLLVWNGDWVRHPGQEGDGLATVREAIMWEVGFAPAACRDERVRGLVLITLDDGPASARIVLGAGTWRWADLLFASRGNATARR